MRWLIGDVHGMFRALENLLKEISRVDPQSVLYFVGDYINRGRESRGVLDLLLSLDNARFIRGNHDDILDLILNGAAYAENPSHGDRYLAFQWFLEHGLLETLQSYGARTDQMARIVSHHDRDELRRVIDLFPPEHRLFIHSLPVFIEDDDLFVIHGKWPLKDQAGPRAGLATAAPSAQLRHDILWGRYTDADLHRPRSWTKTGFFGHTPVPTYRGHETNFGPIICGKMVLLDTAAALSAAGRLTAMCAENMDVIQTDPTGKLVAPQKNVQTV